MSEQSLSNQTTTSPLLGVDKVLDVRPIPCSAKHATIFKTWQGLAVGDHFILLNDHDPVPLRYQFAAEFPDIFGWDYLERGPETFQVKITKLKAIQQAASAANGCCNH